VVVVTPEFAVYDYFSDYFRVIRWYAVMLENRCRELFRFRYQDFIHMFKLLLGPQRLVSNLLHCIAVLLVANGDQDTISGSFYERRIETTNHEGVA